MSFFRVIGRSFADFIRDDGLMLAASMSYFFIMALIPFCLFLITLLGYFLGHYPEFYDFFTLRVMNLFPAVTHEVTDEIVKLISYTGIGKFSLVLYAFLSYQLLGSLENSLNVIFKVKKKRNFFVSVLISIGVITLIIALLLTSFAAASIIPFLKALKAYLPMLKIGRITEFIIRFVLPFVLVLFTVAFMYVILPKTKVRLGDAVKGAVFTAILLEVAKHVFTWYVGSVAAFGRIYGPLTAFIVFLLWAYYSSSILLIGAEIVHNLGGSRKT